MSKVVTRGEFLSIKRLGAYLDTVIFERAGKKDMEKVVEEAKNTKAMYGRRL